MKKYFLLFIPLFLLSATIYAQTIQDDFSDGDFTNNPTWSGTTADFIVNGAFELQTDNLGVSATSEISIPTLIQDSTFWEFYVNMAFAPSTSNYTLVFLQSDNPSPTSTTN